MARKTRGRGLTKADLVDAVYERHGALTKDEAAEIVDAIFGTVKHNLERGRTVKIKNFGVFEVAERAGRVGVNPTSGEPLFIPPHKGLAFRPAARLKKQVAPTRKRPVPAPPAEPRPAGRRARPAADRPDRRERE
jgi:nucleoid DNA-binding protein